MKKESRIENFIMLCCRAVAMSKILGGGGQIKLQAAIIKCLEGQNGPHSSGEKFT